METSGWVKSLRKMKAWQWYKTPNMHHVFSHLLMSVSPYSYQYNGVKYKAGTMMTCSSELASELGLCRQIVMKCLKRLKSTGEIDYPEPAPHTGRWLLTVNNWSKYQGGKSDDSDDVEVVKKINDPQKEDVKKINDQSDLTLTKLTTDVKKINDPPTLLDKENLENLLIREGGATPTPSDESKINSESNPVAQPEATTPYIHPQLMSYPRIDEKGLKLVMDMAESRCLYKMTQVEAEDFLSHYWKYGWTGQNGRAINWIFALQEWCSKIKLKQQGGQNGYRNGTNARDTGAVGTEADFANDPAFGKYPGA